MQQKEEGPSRSEQGFFSKNSHPSPKKAPIQVLFSDLTQSLLFNPENNLLVGYGANWYQKDRHHSSSSGEYWTISLRAQKVKQITAGARHILVLYEDGLLEGYGYGRHGALGIGSYMHQTDQWVVIDLPNDEKATFIAAGHHHSLVISDKGTLYGFGSNSQHQLGFEDRKTVEFPTPIPLPENIIPSAVYAGKERTIIRGKQGEVLGCGIFSDWFIKDDDQTGIHVFKPKRLKTYEKHNPVEFVLLSDSVMLRSKSGEYYFYGFDNNHTIPFDRWSNNIKFPSFIKPVTVSIADTHLTCLTQDGEVWSTQKELSNKREAGFSQIEGVKAVSIACGYGRTFLFNEDMSCYVVGNSSYTFSSSKKDEPLAKPRSLYIPAYTSAPYQSTPLRKPPSPSMSFITRERQDGAVDHSELINALELDSNTVVEIIRPLSYDTKSMMSMIYAFYAIDEQNAAYFETTKLKANYPHVLREHCGQHPVIYLDFSQINLASEYSFSTDMRNLIGNLYHHYRDVLFHGFFDAKNDEDLIDQYQQVILKATFRNPADLLETLIGYLFKYYKKPIKLLINGADIAYRHGMDSISQGQISKVLGGIIERLKTVHNAEVVSKVVVVGVHPSFIQFSNNERVRKVHDLTDPVSLYSPYCIHGTTAALMDEKHYLHCLKISTDEFKQVRQLLDEKQISFPPMQESDYTAKKISLMHCFLQLGLIEIADKPLLTGHITCRLGTEAAQSILNKLYKKWQIQRLNRLTLVFDIDNVLTCLDYADKESALFLQRAGHILNVSNITHYIPPGVIELMRAVHAHPLIVNAFYSTGKMIRNDEFVDKLLHAALGKKPIEDERKVLSREHLVTMMRFQLENQRARFGIGQKEGKKDVTQALRPGDDPHNAILIDNSPESVLYGQEKNYLHCMTIKTNHFKALGEKDSSCDGPDDLLYQTVNAPFYLAGVIQHLLQIKDKESIEEFLFSLQFKQMRDDENGEKCYTPDFMTSKQNQAFYTSGLEWLRTYNPALQLINKKMYADVLTVEIAPQEQQSVQDALTNEHDDNCIVM